VSQVGEYFDRLFLTALASPQVKRAEKVRQQEDATGHIGFMRYRLTLSNDDLLELAERNETSPQQATGYQNEQDPERSRSKLRGIAPCKGLKCERGQLSCRSIAIIGKTKQVA
jgi:hypothetical protein